MSGGRGEEVETEQEAEEIANHLSQDHCKQDLFHHQPSDEGRIQNWRKLSAGSFFFFPQVENPLNRLVILAKHGSMMLAGDCHFIQVPSQSSEMKLKLQVVNDVGARDADWVDWFIGVDKVQNRTGDWFFGVAALRNDVSWMQDQCSLHFLTVYLL